MLEEYNLRYCRVMTPGNQTLVFADMTSEQATLENLVHTCIFVGVVSFLTFLGLSVLLLGGACGGAGMAGAKAVCGRCLP